MADLTCHLFDQKGFVIMSVNSVSFLNLLLRNTLIHFFI